MNGDLDDEWGGLGPDPPVTEDSVALRFAEEQAGQLRYCGMRRGWYAFDGAIWRRDRTGVAVARLRALVRALNPKNSGMPSCDPFAYKPPRAAGMGTARFAAGVERLARCDPALAVTADIFDADPFLLGTPDGPVALRSGRKLAADPSQNLSKSTAVGPAETADCPLWLRFLDQTFADPDLVRFLQQFLGTALTGDTREQVLLFGHGTGGNGKSVLLRTIAGLMGDYAATVAPGTFTSAAVTGNDRHPTEIARLAGARLVTMAETESDAAWDETRLKLLTGGDPVTARFMRTDSFTFTPRFKLIVIGNQRPALTRVDEAMRRRLCLVPFTRRPEVPDPMLAERLRAEWPGILRWMIEGCLDWQANGLIRPQPVLEATDAYLGTQDVLGQFLDEACECAPGDAARTAPSGALIAAWSAFARDAGEPAGSQRGFAEALQARGFSRGRTFAGRHFAGLRLRSDLDASARSMTA